MDYLAQRRSQAALGEHPADRFGVAVGLLGPLDELRDRVRAVAALGAHGDAPAQGRALLQGAQGAPQRLLRAVVLRFHEACGAEGVAHAAAVPREAVLGDLVESPAAVRAPEPAGVPDRLAERHAFVDVLHREAKEGLGRAYIAGFKWALEREYDFVFEMDGDFSHNPDDIPALLQSANESDLVLGSRYINGIRIINWPLGRLMLSKTAATYVRIVTGMPYTDPTGGYKCFHRRALEAINLDEIHSNGYSFQIEMTHKMWRQRMRIAEVPIIFTDRLQGHSKMSKQIVREAVWMVLRLFFQNKMRRKPVPLPPKKPASSTSPLAQGRD